MEAATAPMVDLNTLSRRELQALCKLNGVRANMTNLAMAEGLQSLPSVDGIDQIGTTLCLPTPGKSAMKSALRTADQQQQQGSPLPRGRRVSVKSPEAIRMDAEEEVDETKRDLFREIVRTPGVALRSASRRPRATPAPPVPTPAAGTLRRSLRSTARKAAAPVGEDIEVSTAKRSARKTVRPMAMTDLDQEEEVPAAATPEEDKVQQVEPKGVTSDEKCDDPEEEEVTKLPEEGNSKTDVQEQGVEGAAIGEEQKLVKAEKSDPLSAMEDSPILGVLSKEAPEPAMKKAENALTEDCEVFGNWSPVQEIADEISCASEDKEIVAVEVPVEAAKEDAFSSTIEVAVAPNKMISTAVTEMEPVNELLQADLKDDQSAEKYDLVAESSEVDDLDDDEEDMLKADRTVDVKSVPAEPAFSSTTEAPAEPNQMVPAAVTEKQVSVDELPQADLTDDESNEEYDLDGESSEVDDLEEEEGEDMLKVDQTVDEESDYTVEASGSIDVNFDSDEEEEHLMETGEETKDFEASDSLTEDEDDFSADLSSEFDDVLDFSDAETAAASPLALEGINPAAASSAAKNVESVITEEMDVSSEGGVVSQHVETIVKSLDDVTVTEEKKEECANEKKQVKVGKEMSLRKLKSAYKESLIAAKEGKKLTIASGERSREVLAQLDDNAEC